MALPYPQDPAAPSAPNPYFQDNSFVRGDQSRSWSAQAWANMEDLDARETVTEGDIVTIQGDVSALQADVIALEAQVQKVGQPDYRGLYVSNDLTNPTTKIIIAAGQALGLDVGGVFCWPLKLASAMTKLMTSTWAAGTGNGGLDTGSVAANTWYYPWLILNLTSSAVDVLLSASSTAPTMPSGYTVKRRLRGAFLTDAATSICGFSQDANYVTAWSNSAAAPSTNKTFQDVDATNPGTSAVLATLTVPPLGVTARIIVRMYQLSGPSSTYGLYVSPTAAKDEAPASGGTVNGPNGQITNLGAAAESTQSLELNIPVDTSKQIRYRLGYSDGYTKVQINTLGFLEPLSEAA